MRMPAKLWGADVNARAVCHLCAHACHLSPGSRGKCGVRVNMQGQLVSLVDDVVTAVNLDPVEKKPLYHFLPGSGTFSIGSAGCNFFCRFCQNSGISRIPSDGSIHGHRMRPEELVSLVRQQKAASLAFTYNEPTVFFELMESVMALCPELPVILVSNGYMSHDCLLALRDRVRAVNIDLKSFRESFYHHYCGAHLQPVLNTLKAVRKLGWWLEVTTLVIPNVNDDTQELADIAAFVRDELGADTPWHISAFHGAYLMADHPPTPLATLERARDIGRAAGLHFVYMGNVRSADGGNTICPSCGAVLMERIGFAVRRHDKNGVCVSCGYRVPGVWEI